MQNMEMKSRRVPRGNSKSKTPFQLERNIYNIAQIVIQLVRQATVHRRVRTMAVKRVRRNGSLTESAPSCACATEDLRIAANASLRNKTHSLRVMLYASALSLWVDG